MITALHVNCTLPFQIRQKGRKYRIDKFEILTTILSALTWRRDNGNIKLYTDSMALEYYDSLGILDLWNGGIDTETLENTVEYIDQNIFWAAGKLLALRNEPAPIAMIDTDLIVWKPITDVLERVPISVLHREPLYPGTYLPQEYLKVRKGYRFDPEWDWGEPACNTACVFLADQSFKDYYTNCAIDFMTENCELPKEMVSQMVFAEQRMLVMCAKKKMFSIHHFLDDPYQRENTTFTHIWGGKDVARAHASQNELLCLALLRKIETLFPAYYEKIKESGLVYKILSK
ncbi:Uncharacterised protein [Porphyromonas crevioricanis]|uniref:DUF6734 domain-containing protein n=2 Tax=Porphyromonas crevioricanis TaxID=393921 RepID=A0A2X4PLE3_9PORP|nr:hypothetical protein SAMN02745203_01103 [Porphyromonas crevioricanis]SQH73185.1 Uncharacterised protein [Porphyromonas crevioricanis]